MNWINLAGLFLLMGLLAGCTSTDKPVLPISTVTTPASGTATDGRMPGTSTIDLAGHTLLAQGMFMNGVHTVSGTVNVYEKAGRRLLVFTDFRTDGGPDLRIYLAENTGLRNFIEVSKLNSSGNFSVELPAEADPAKQRHVLIWCKAFSVLFGNAELK